MPDEETGPNDYEELPDKYLLANGYKPCPLRLESHLPASLEALEELLAENVHNVWAEMRIRGGWSYGSSKDDGTKRHPNLVPFALLPKDVITSNRVTARGSVLTVRALGYKVVAPSLPHASIGKPRRLAARFAAGTGSRQAIHPHALPCLRTCSSRIGPKG